MSAQIRPDGRCSTRTRGHSTHLKRGLAIGLITVALGGCVTIAQPGPGGELTGKLVVEWVGENRFLYLPDPKDPLTFVTTDGKRITPRPMYTDGGSIPPILQPIRGFSPWGYGPAYIIHDWLFEQHHCGYPGAEQISFDDSARILGEVIDTLMRVGLVPLDAQARALIEAGVRTSFARQLWERGKCDAPPILSARRAAPQGPSVFRFDFSQRHPVMNFGRSSPIGAMRP